MNESNSEKKVTLHVEVIFDVHGRLIEIKKSNVTDGLVSLVADLPISCPSCQNSCKVNLLVHDAFSLNQKAISNHTALTDSTDALRTDAAPAEIKEEVIEYSGDVAQEVTQENVYCYPVLKEEVVQTEETAEAEDSDATTLTADCESMGDDSSETMSGDEDENIRRPPSHFTAIVQKVEPHPQPDTITYHNSNTEKYGCAYCLQIFNSSQSLLLHKNNHDLSCSICNPCRSFSNLYGLGYHVWLKHRELRDKMDVLNSKQCYKCHTKYFDQSYVRHIKTCTGRTENEDSALKHKRVRKEPTRRER